MKRRELEMGNVVSRLVAALSVFAMFAVNAQADESQGRRIEEAKFVEIGGIEQWITIRGDDSRNPVLLILHGGPAEPQSPLIQIYAPWEKEFVVVQWDQRGAGKTFGRYGKGTPDMTVEKMTQDVIDLTNYLRGDLHREKIILLGHSWGSFLGVQAVRKHPELFAAFVGTGQVESWERTVAIQYEYTLDRSREAKNEKAVETLMQIGPPPYKDLQQYMGMRRLFNSYMAPTDVAWPQKEATLYAEQLSKEDLAAYQAGAQFSLGLLAPTMFSMDLTKLGTDFAVPIVIIEGGDDYITPVKAAKEYFDAIKAPQKRFIPIDGAGHFAAMTHSDAFLEQLVKVVKPIATKGE